MTRRPLLDVGSVLGGLSGGAGRTAVDVSESDEAFTVTMDLPGYDEDEITIRMTDHRLHVEAERETESETEEDEAYLRKERRRQSVSRTIQLPEHVDEDAAEATYRSGVLTITVPKESEESETEYTVPIS